MPNDEHARIFIAFCERLRAEGVKIADLDRDTARNPDPDKDANFRISMIAETLINGRPERMLGFGYCTQRTNWDEKYGPEAP